MSDQLFGDMTDVSNRLAAQSRKPAMPQSMNNASGQLAEAIPEIPEGMVGIASQPQILSEAVTNSCGVNRRP